MVLVGVGSLSPQPVLLLDKLLFVLLDVLEQQPAREIPSEHLLDFGGCLMLQILPLPSDLPNLPDQRLLIAID